MKQCIHCAIANSRRRLWHALKIRTLVFHGELKTPIPDWPYASCLLDQYDLLSTTIIIVAYDGNEPVGTVRLLLPNAQVATENKIRLGLDLERKFDLGGLACARIGLAEVSRVSIRRPWRHSNASSFLCRRLYTESRKRGVTHWIGSANVDTDSLTDAHIAYQLLQRQGQVSELWRVLPSPQASSTSLPWRPAKEHYTPSERLRAKAGHLDGLQIPPLLRHYEHMLGARYLGEPIFDADFELCSMPLIVALGDIPERTLSPVQPGASHPLPTDEQVLR